MHQLSESADVKRPRAALTLLEVIVVVVVIAILIALLLPSVECSREASRRVKCNNNVKQLVLGVLQYEEIFQMYPAGTICGSRPTMPGNQYDVWAEAGRTGPEDHGTSFLLAILPYLEQDEVIGNALTRDWASGREGSGTKAGCWSPAANAEIKDSSGSAMSNFGFFYCPSRTTSSASKTARCCFRLPGPAAEPIMADVPAAMRHLP